MGLKTHVVFNQVFVDITRPKTCVLGQPASVDKRLKTCCVWKQSSQDIICLQILISEYHWSQDTRLRTFVVFRHSVSSDPP